MWRLDKIAQIQRVVDRRRFGVWRGCQRPVDLAGRGIARQIEEAANEGAKHASSSLDAEVERPAHVAGEAELGAKRLQFLDETRLADARLAAHDDDCTRLPVSDRRERAAALGKLGAATDQRAALGRGLSQSLQAEDGNGVIEASKDLFPESFVVRQARGRLPDLLRCQDFASSGTA